MKITLALAGLMAVCIALFPMMCKRNAEKIVQNTQTIQQNALVQERREESKKQQTAEKEEKESENNATKGEEKESADWKPFRI